MKFDLKRVFICLGAAIIIAFAVYQIFHDQIQVSMNFQDIENKGE